jgi:RNA polymerase sigma-70 factor (ECF subfamily)
LNNQLPPPFAEAYATEVAFVWRSLRRLGVRERDVEDACQETFLVAHKKYDTFTGGSLRAWLFAIAKRIASDHRKKAHVRREVLDPDTPGAFTEKGEPETMTEALDQKRARALLDEMLDALDDDKRAVFILFELEQWPMAEVARVLECPVQTAYSRLHVAREAVERAIERVKSRGAAAP